MKSLATLCLALLALAWLPACGRPAALSVQVTHMGRRLPSKTGRCRARVLNIDIQTVGLAFETVAHLRGGDEQATLAAACRVGVDYIVPTVGNTFFAVKPRAGVVIDGDKVTMPRAVGATTSARAGSAGKGPVVAVFPLEDRAKAVSADEGQQLTDYLATQLASARSFRVVPASLLRQRLRAQKKESYRSCYDTSCQIALGKALAAEKSLASKVLRLGDACSLTANLYDLKTEAAERAATVTVACTVSAIRKGIDQLTAKLAD